MGNAKCDGIPPSRKSLTFSLSFHTVSPWGWITDESQWAGAEPNQILGLLSGDYFLLLWETLHCIMK